MYSIKRAFKLAGRLNVGALHCSLGAALYIQTPTVMGGALDDANEQYRSDEIVLVDASSPIESHEIKDGGLLKIIEGGVAIAVKATRSTVIMQNGTIRAGLVLSDSISDIRDSFVSNAAGVGLDASISAGSAKPGSTVSVSDSHIEGSEAGALIGPLSVATFVGSDIEGINGLTARAQGVLVAGGEINLLGRSSVRGDLNGIHIADGDRIVSGGVIPTDSRVVVDNSTVQGLNGAAIKIEMGETATVFVQNNSALISGNGNLLEIEDSSSVDFTLDASALTGNLVADDTSTLNVTLQKNANLTGDIINGNNLSINSGAQWQMVGDNSVKSMSLNGGQVRFGLDGFHTLSLGELSGTGVFGMKIDLDSGLGDLLSVNGQANGDFTLKVKNTGTESVSPDVQPLQIVHTEGGDAQFNLLGDKVDLGTYSYELEKQGNDWFIVGSGKTISPSTQSALALFNAAPTVFMSELTTLRSRMGEVRGSGEGGGWMRAYGSRFDASTSAGVNYRQQQRGMTFGADAPIPVSNGQLLVGLLGGYSKSDLDLSRGSSGTVDSYYVGAYSTWLSEQGYYVDAVLKLNKLQNESKVAMSDQTKAEGDYTNTAFGGSLEVGKHIKLGDDYFVEPYAQMAAVVVQGDSYTLDNGLEAKNDRTQSVLGKVGSSVGRNIALKDGGVLQPYLRAAVAHEFARNNKVTVNDTSFNNDLFGSRAELGVGVAVTLSKNLQVHADFDYMKGNNVEQPWGANVGVRLAF
jgi:outer membrane autotransporter protein